MMRRGGRGIYPLTLVAEDSYAHVFVGKLSSRPSVLRVPGWPFELGLINEVERWHTIQHKVGKGHTILCELKKGHSILGEQEKEHAIQNKLKNGHIGFHNLPQN